MRILQRIRSGKYDHLVAEILEHSEREEAANPNEVKEIEGDADAKHISTDAPSSPASLHTDQQDTPPPSSNQDIPQQPPAEEPTDNAPTPPLQHTEDPKQWYLNDEKFAAYIRLSRQRNEQLREFVLQLKKPFAEMPNQQVEPADSAPKQPERRSPVEDKWYLNDELFAAYMDESKKDTKKLTEFVHEMKSVAYSMGLHVELRSIDEQLD